MTAPSSLSNVVFLSRSATLIPSLRSLILSERREKFVQRHDDNIEKEQKAGIRKHYMTIKEKFAQQDNIEIGSMKLEDYEEMNRSRQAMTVGGRARTADELLQRSIKYSL